MYYSKPLFTEINGSKETEEHIYVQGRKIIYSHYCNHVSVAFCQLCFTRI